MRSVQMNKIDGFDTITGFQKRPIDPEETRKQNALAILETDESKAMKNKLGQQTEYGIKLQGARKKAAFHFGQLDKGVDIEKNKEIVAAQNKIADDIEGFLNVCTAELKPCILAFSEKAKEILTNNPVFFEARKNEIIKTAEEITDLITKFAEKTQNQVLLVGGTYADDFRGKIYYEKIDGVWASTKIMTLGVKKTPGGKYTEDLTAEEIAEISAQKATARINELTDEEKTNEYSLKCALLLSQSVEMRAGLEIQSMSAEEALMESQSFYNTKLGELKLKYGIV